MSGHGEGAWNHPEWRRLYAAFHATRPGSAERREVCLALADACEEAGDRWFADAWRAEAGAQGRGGG